MILVDTSIWVNHFRRSSAILATLLQENLVHTHPFVLGELACGQLPNRAKLLKLLADLPMLPPPPHSEVFAFIETRSLMGKGLGWTDVNLLASALLFRAPLWSADLRLAKVATSLNIAFHPGGGYN